MTNEELLFNLVNSRDENSILVAQDLAMELNCGIPKIVAYTYDGMAGRRYIIYRSKAGIYDKWNTQCVYHLTYNRAADSFGLLTQRTQSGLDGRWRALIECRSSNRYGISIHSWAGCLASVIALTGNK